MCIEIGELETGTEVFVWIGENHLHYAHAKQSDEPPSLLFWNVHAPDVPSGPEEDAQVAEAVKRGGGDEESLLIDAVAVYADAFARVRHGRTFDVLVDLRDDGADAPARREDHGDFAEALVERLQRKDAQVVQADGDLGQRYAEWVQDLKHDVDLRQTVS